MIDAALLAKFKRRAPKIASQGHLDKAMRAFPLEYHEEIAPQIQLLLKGGLIARKVEAVPELKPQDPENLTIHESTVQRLNAMAATIADRDATIKALKAERDSLKRQLQDSGLNK